VGDPDLGCGGPVGDPDGDHGPALPDHRDGLLEGLGTAQCLEGDVDALISDRVPLDEVDQIYQALDRGDIVGRALVVP